MSNNDSGNNKFALLEDGEPKQDTSGPSGGRNATRGGRRGGRGGRGGGGGRGREFDRHSGAEHNERQRKEGGGKYNWGKPGQDGEARPVRAPRNFGPEVLTVNDAKMVDEEGNEIPEGKTLAEFRAENVHVGSTNTRAASNKDFKGESKLKVLSTKKEADVVVAIPSTVKTTGSRKKRRQKNQQGGQSLSLAEFASAAPKGGNGGNSRGGRGGRGRGGRPNLNDNNSFPSLSK
jgi:plasminogen activator inhibitor 1 RNA-binding protein